MSKERKCCGWLHEGQAVQLGILGAQGCQCTGHHAMGSIGMRGLPREVAMPPIHGALRRGALLCWEGQQCGLHVLGLQRPVGKMGAPQGCTSI